MDLKDATMANLNGKFIVNNYPSASADVYFDDGAGPVVLAVKDNKVYKVGLEASDLADVTKGTLIAEVDDVKKEISWTQKHDEDNLYDTFGGVRVSGYDGADAGVPLLQAIGLFFKGINVTAYDPYILGLEDLLKIIYNADGSNTGTTTTTTTVAPATTTTTTVAPTTTTTTTASNG